MKRLLLATAALVAAPFAALAAEKPAELKVGITTFLTGPASVFGVPGRDAAELLVEKINANGGIGGVPVRLSFIDEGAGAEALTAEFRRQVQNGADAMFSAISSGNCQTLAPLAEDLNLSYSRRCGWAPPGASLTPLLRAAV